jgi:hypothetical protein|tara:strand:- start:3506 stop:3649 length:144 start_codon:yes stop_codon:yes gene_type:complete
MPETRVTEYIEAVKRAVGKYGSAKLYEESGGVDFDAMIHYCLAEMIV